MSTTAEKIAERIAALPETDQAEISEDVLGYVDELVALRTALKEAEDDVAAGRVKPANSVFERLLGKYAS